MDESRIAWSVLEDATEGFELGLSSVKTDRAMIICNTKFSDHAKLYAKCKGIYQIGWSSPPDCGLQILIEEKKLYPITSLRGLKTRIRIKLLDAEIILLRQLMEKSPEELEKETGIEKKTLNSIIENARTVLEDS